MRTTPTILPFEIREATKSDLSLILSFIKDLAAYEKLSHEVTADEQQLERTLFGNHPSAKVIIGYYDGKPAAFSIYFTNYSTFLSKPGMYLEDLFVKPEFRGKGLGKAMLLHLAKIAHEKGYGRFEWAVLDWNEPAIEFYKSLGAVPMNEWTVFRLTADKLKSLAEGASKV